MANRIENQFGMALESTYNTPVTVTRFYPYLDGTDGQWDTRQRQGVSTFVGTKRGMRGDRRVLPIGQGVIVVKTELSSRQAGLLLQAANGVGTSTIVTGAAYQQVFTPTISGTLAQSWTIQLGKVLNDGTVSVETYAGCVATQFEIDCPEDGIPMISVTFDARSVATATALATASYTAGAFLFDQSQGAVTLGGAYTHPTATALGTATTAFLNFKSWKLTVNHTADLGRWVLGGRNQPTWGICTAAFEGSAEANDQVLRTAYLAGTSVPVVITHTTTELVSATATLLQLAIPQLFLKNPILPPMDLDTSVLTAAGEITFNGTNDLYALVVRTADTAL